MRFPKEKRMAEGWLAMKWLGSRRAGQCAILTLGSFSSKPLILNTNGANGKLKVSKIIP